MTHADGRVGADAVVTVISSGGAELGRVRADTDGRFAVERTAAGSPHLLVVRADGVSQAEPLVSPASTTPTVDVEIAERGTSPVAPSVPHAPVAAPSVRAQA